MELKIKEPKGLAFSVKVLEKESKENVKPVPLKRITFVVKPTAKELKVKIAMKIKTKE